MIPGAAIDDDEARGLDTGTAKTMARSAAFTVLLECKPLLILAAALACFHLGNAAMLPLYGMAVVSAKQGDPAGFVAITIVVAQGTMILASLIAMRLAEKEGYWLVLLISFIALPIRGVIAAYVIEQMGCLSGADPRRDRRRTCRALPYRALSRASSTAPGASMSARARS